MDTKVLCDCLPFELSLLILYVRIHLKAFYVSSFAKLKIVSLITSKINNTTISKKLHDLRHNWSYVAQMLWEEFAKF